MNKDELADQLALKADDLERAIKKDDGPNRVRLPSGDYLEGEGADMWFEFQYGIIDMLRNVSQAVRDL